jgi:hypothetical protein
MVPLVGNPDTTSYPIGVRGPLGIDTNFIDFTTHWVSMVCATIELSIFQVPANESSYLSPCCLRRATIMSSVLIASSDGPKVVGAVIDARATSASLTSRSASRSASTIHSGCGGGGGGGSTTGGRMVKGGRFPYFVRFFEPPDRLEAKKSR